MKAFINSIKIANETARRNIHQAIQKSDELLDLPLGKPPPFCFKPASTLILSLNFITSYHDPLEERPAPVRQHPEGGVGLHAERAAEGKLPPVPGQLRAHEALLPRSADHRRAVQAARPEGLRQVAERAQR